MERKLMAGVFGTGAAVMVLELLGTRIVAPYIGSSMYVWTSMIGVILGAMALGYYLGGELAKKWANMDTLGYVVCLSAVWVILLALFKDPVLRLAATYFVSDYLSSVLITLILFGVPAILLGIVSPMVAQILIHRSEMAGEWVGKLYAISTMGSIFGTFLTGFWLIPTFGHLRVLYLTAFVLSFIGWWWSENKKVWQVVLLIFTFVGLFRLWSFASLSGNMISDTDTAYSRVTIGYEQDGGRSMWINGARSSKVYLDDPLKLGFNYYPYYDLMFWNGKRDGKALMIGGAGLGYPRYLTKKYPEVKLTVVEIDKGLFDLATQYLGYKEERNITLVFQDGRMFLNKNNEKYSAVLLDVFSGYTVPSHMVTREAVREMKKSLDHDGVVVMNMIGAASGEKSVMVRNIHAVFAEQFKNVSVFGVVTSNPTAMQNMVLVASDFDLSNTSSLNTHEKKMLGNKMSVLSGRVFTDDWSPTDFYSTLSMMK